MKPKVSVISIALWPAEFEPLRERLARQTFQDFEFVGEAGGTIPEAWNRAVARARGQILVFTETDAFPVDERWLEQLVGSVPDERTMVKGLEIDDAPWNLANLAVHRSVLEGARFDESFLWAEDTEFFCRLKQRGCRLIHVDTAPVIHRNKPVSPRVLRRAFRYGIYHARLDCVYGAEGVGIAPARYALFQLVRSALNLAGFAAGYLIYKPQQLLGRRRADHVPVRATRKGRRVSRG